MKKTVRKSSNVSQFFSQGKRITTPYCIILYFKTDDPLFENKIATIAGKKLGNAVKRNRAKRRLRAVIERLGGPWQGYSAAFIAKPSIFTEDLENIVQACKVKIPF